MPLVNDILRAQQQQISALKQEPEILEGVITEFGIQDWPITPEWPTGGTYLVKVLIDGAATPMPVQIMAEYMPNVGDRCLLVKVGKGWVALGRRLKHPSNVFQGFRLPDEYGDVYNLRVPVSTLDQNPNAIVANFTTEWNDFAATPWAPLGLYVDRDGWVTIDGMARRVSGTNTTILTINSPWFRPRWNQVFACRSHTGTAEQPCRVDILQTGEIRVWTPAIGTGANNFVSLSGIRYQSVKVFGS